MKSSCKYTSRFSPFRYKESGALLDVATRVTPAASSAGYAWLQRISGKGREGSASMADKGMRNSEGTTVAWGRGGGNVPKQRCVCNVCNLKLQRDV